MGVGLVLFVGWVVGVVLLSVWGFLVSGRFSWVWFVFALFVSFAIVLVGFLVFRVVVRFLGLGLVPVVVVAVGCFVGLVLVFLAIFYDVARDEVRYMP